VTLAWVALFSLSFLWVQTQQSLAVCPPTCGIEYTVDSTGDGKNVGPVTQCNDGTGHCTLRAAIQASNGHAGVDGIVFNIPTAGNNCDASGNCTINLGAALPDLSDAVTISGPGPDKLTVKRSTVSGTPQFRIFNVTTTGTVSFSGLTIANGSPVGNGGGIQNVNAGTVNVTNSTLSGNKALSSSNNSTFVGGGISNNSTGTINVTNSTLTNNFATASGTNGTNSPSGGGIFNAGTVNIINSTLDGNRAETSDASASGGGIYNAGTVNLTNSTLLNNGTGFVDGQSLNFVNASGGGIFNDTGTVNVTNSTLSGNYAFAVGSASALGGGIFNDSGTVNVTNSTLSSNYCSGFPSPTMVGGGIFNGAGVVKVKSTIIALSTVIAPQSGTVGSNPDASGTFTSQGFNLIGKRDGSGTGFTTDPTDQTGTVAAPRDPKFEIDATTGKPFLKNNGGPTSTIALLFGSPAIDKGTSQCLTCGSTGVLTTDQRGTGFPRTFNDPAIPNATGGDGTDIGAFEVQTTPTPTPTPTATPTGTPTATPGLVANVSTRLPVGTGDNVLIEGFTVQGPAGSTKKIIVRAIGPYLAACCGITDALANPTLEIHDSNNNNAIVATNDDWKVTQFGTLITADQSAEIAASGVPPSNDLESAIIANLPPSSYTAVVRGVGNSVGTGVVDAYDLSAASPARLVNVATRGLIQPGDGLMIAGFITQNGPVRAVVKAIGPSLAAFGITNALADTTLQIRDGHGAIVVENDDWKIRTNGTSQQAEIEATGQQPTNDLEAAVLVILPPGQYSALVRGKPETTGTGVVQVYFLQ
jgi:hypothetical protein